MTVVLIGLYSQMLATVVYALLAAWQLGRGGPGSQAGSQHRMFGAAFAMTAVWSATTVLVGPLAPLAGAAESGRNLLWFTFLLRLFEEEGGGVRRPGVIGLYAVLAVAMTIRIVIGFLPAADMRVAEDAGQALFFVSLALRILVAAGGLLMLHNLYIATAREARWRIRGPLIALTVMWTWDLNLYTVAYLLGAWPTMLLALRPPMMLALVLPFAIATRRSGPWRLKLSRAAAFQSFSLLAIGGYLIFMVLATRAMAAVGGNNMRSAQIMLILIMSVAAAILLPSARVRAWLRVKIAKHFFAHRYDYREEWLRFTGTLGQPGGHAAALETRVIKAVADIVEAPGGLLLVDDGTGRLTCGARWQRGIGEPPSVAGERGFADHVERTGRILELDVLRGDDPDHLAEQALTPPWLLADTAAWIAVPLIHLDKLAGIVICERPRAARLLDWEDFDLLKVAGRQVASYLAEARGQEALSDAKRFDEFNRRFAFILHDIKNLVSQLSLVARNAERHADKPDFRADMVATLQGSVGKMNALLALLSQNSRADPAAPRPLRLRAFVEDIAGARRDPNPIAVEGDGAVVALADPARLEQALVHILQNAVDASPADAPIRVAVGMQGAQATVAIADSGRGMSPDFIRTGLFKPFASTKANGFGVGAFEARTLLAAMGGAVEVESQEGTGSRFTLSLPLAPAAAMAAVPDARSA